MTFNEQTIKKIARLARLKFPEAEAAKFQADVDGILNWVAELQEVDVSGVEPLISVSPRETAQRADVVTEGDQQAELMQNAPEAVQGFYTVPKMVE